MEDHKIKTEIANGYISERGNLIVGTLVFRKGYPDHIKITGNCKILIEYLHYYNNPFHKSINRTILLEWKRIR